jgi:hypothetical protein
MERHEANPPSTAAGLSEMAATARVKTTTSATTTEPAHDQTSIVRRVPGWPEPWRKGRPPAPDWSGRPELPAPSLIQISGADRRLG